VTGLQVLIHSGIIEGEGPTLLLRTVECDVSARFKNSAPGPRVSEKCDTDARTDDDIANLQGRSGRRRIDAISTTGRAFAKRGPRARVSGRAGQQDGELVAANRAIHGRGVAHAVAAGRPATKRSSSSPAAWPSVSLTSLKWSRSRQSTGELPTLAELGNRRLQVAPETARGSASWSARRGAP